jgi:hypothetical protein
VEAKAEGVICEAAGDVEEAVAESFGFAACELAVEQQPLGPGEQVLRGQGELEPGGVGRARRTAATRPGSSAASARHAVA